MNKTSPGLAEINRELVAKADEIDSPRRGSAGYRQHRDSSLRFAKPEIYEALEERSVKCAIRVPANCSLERDIAELLTRLIDRPDHKPVVWYKGFLYQAASWKTMRRVVAKVEFHFGDLFLRVGFIGTNLETDRWAVVRFYKMRHGGAVD